MSREILTFSVDNCGKYSLNLTVMEKALRAILNQVVKRLTGSELGTIEIEIPKEEGFGDLSTPVAMGLAKVLKKPPRKIAEEIVAMIEPADIFEKIEIAGPGFINFYFSRVFICCNGALSRQH